MDFDVSQLANEFLYAVHRLKSKDPNQILSSLDLIQKILLLHLSVPMSFSKQIFIKLAFLKRSSKHSDILSKALAVERSLLQHYDSS